MAGVSISRGFPELMLTPEIQTPRRIPERMSILSPSLLASLGELRAVQESNRERLYMQP